MSTRKFITENIMRLCLMVVLALIFSAQSIYAQGLLVVEGERLPRVVN